MLRQRPIIEVLERLVASVTALNEAVTNLTTEVDAAVARIGNPPVESPTQAEVDQITSDVNAQADKLKTAVG